MKILKYIDIAAQNDSKTIIIGKILKKIKLYKVIQVLPPERKHTLLIDLKFSKNSGMIV
jgi:hypothetical protein